LVSPFLKKKPASLTGTLYQSFFGNKAAKEQIKAYNDTKEFNNHFEEQPKMFAPE
jgi:hypothetical protein